MKELVSHEKNHAESVMEFFATDERLQNPTMRRDYFAQLDENDFLDIVQKTAGLVRSGEAENQYFDGENVSLMFHEVPDQREKEQLLRETWGVAQEFLQNNELPDDDALDYAALTVAGGILYAHPFADGNGRTSRALSYVMARGGNAQELQEILAESNGGGTWNVQPFFLAGSESKEYVGSHPDRIQWDDAFAGEAEDALGGEIANSGFNTTILREFIEQNNELAQPYIEKASTGNKNEEIILNGQAFIAELVRDEAGGVEDARKLLEIRRNVQAGYVRQFLESMRSGERIDRSRSHFQEIPTRDGMDDANKEKAHRIIQTMSDEIGRRAVYGLLTPADQRLAYHRARSEVRHKVN